VWGVFWGFFFVLGGLFCFGVLVFLGVGGLVGVLLVFFFVCVVCVVFFFFFFFFFGLFFFFLVMHDCFTQFPFPNRYSAPPIQHW